MNKYLIIVKVNITNIHLLIDAMIAKLKGPINILIAKDVTKFADKMNLY